MAFNTLEYLEQGKVDFVLCLNYYDCNHLIENVRQSINRLDIINGFLNKLIDKMPYFCFKIIYDIEQYKEEVLYLICKYKISPNSNQLIDILYHTSWGKDYIFNHLDEILEKYEATLTAILDFIFINLNDNQKFIDKLYLHKNLHIRFLFMNYLVIKQYDKISLIYDDITKYLTSFTYQEFEQLTFLPELMKMEDISNLAISFFRKGDKETYLKLKKFILENYKTNNLALLLLKNINSMEEKEKNISEFAIDANTLFETSDNYQFEIYKSYSQYLTNDILENFRKFLSYFHKKADNNYFDVSNIFWHGLGLELREYVIKYLSLSKRHDAKYILSGSTTSCYRIGDYTFKLNRTKWSYEDVICPNLYLIIKNLEEHYVRDENGVVQAGIEIQKYLTKSLRDLPSDILSEALVFVKNELKRLGYYSADTIINGRCGDNCMLLDSYKDADHYNPEILPKFFKKYPVVLIDRDLVYKLENKNPKRLFNDFS